MLLLNFRWGIVMDINVKLLTPYPRELKLLTISREFWLWIGFRWQKVREQQSAVQDQTRPYLVLQSPQINLWLLTAELALTLYHTIPTFNDPEEKVFWKHHGKRRKCWPAFSPFPMMFSTLLEPDFSFSVTSIFSFPMMFSTLLKTNFSFSVTSIFSFPTMFSTLLKTNFSFSVTYILSSANALNLDQYKILLFGKELKHAGRPWVAHIDQLTHYLPNDKIWHLPKF